MSDQTAESINAKLLRALAEKVKAWRDDLNAGKIDGLPVSGLNDRTLKELAQGFDGPLLPEHKHLPAQLAAINEGSQEDQAMFDQLDTIIDIANNTGATPYEWLLAKLARGWVCLQLTELVTERQRMARQELESRAA